MSEISRSALFSKLNKPMYKSLENAFVLTKLRENKYVELSHWFYQILQIEQSDLFFIQQYFELDLTKILNDIENELNILKNGYTSVNDFSENIVQLLEETWLYCSLKFNSTQIRSSYILYTLLTSQQFKNQFIRLSNEFMKIKPESLLENLDEICACSIEKNTQVSISNSEQSTDGSGQSALEKFGTNLTLQARDQKLDPVTARDNEIRQMIDILLRKRQNNPLLTGEAGVGKTAVVEGLALKIIEKDVPPALLNVEIILLDIGALKAGASVSGEFENRLKAVIREVHQSERPIILFIDEIHTLIGAGGAAGTADAANLLKPALARGELRTIGATTWSEYKKYFEKDPALTRRFQVVQIEEPSENVANNMLRTLSGKLEAHHKVIILDEAIEAAVKLSKRYIPARQLPDKAIGVLDTACARVSSSLNAVPIKIKQLHQEIDALKLKKQHLIKQKNLGHQIKSEVHHQILTEINSYEQQYNELTERYQQEKKLINELQTVRQKIVSTHQDNLEQLKQKQEELLENLKLLQGEKALIFSVVDENLIAEIIGEWTGIPVGKMIDNEIQKILHLAETLNQRVIGQRHGLEAIVKKIQTSKAKLEDPNKPVGVFMLAGPSGVGKTETALALADAMYGGEHNLITINMSEYQEPHTISSLKGAPPGYVGYGEGGVLTEAVRRKPYSVILLDEIEKAHSDVHEIFFQVFDKGWMEDGEGRYIDFKNTVILLTTNVGSDLTMNLCEDEDLKPDVQALQQALREPLLKVFPAALLGRIQTIPYYPLSSHIMNRIVKLQLNRIVKRIQNNHDITLTYTNEVIDYIVSRCHEIESGGRMIDSIITNNILPSISLKILSSTGSEPIKQICILMHEGNLNYDFS